jgi:hypothetical protein
MKINLILIFVCAISFTSFGQNTTETPAETRQQVQIINSDSRGVIFLENYFNEGISAAILQQVDEEKFTFIKALCGEDSYPECFKEATAYSLTDDAKNLKIDAVFAVLKTYRIATFDNIRNGENFGEESILVVPASENTNVDGSCNFEYDFYIIIPTSAIKVL